MKNILSDNRLYIILSAGLLRMGLYGYCYYPLLDDYIQFEVYPLMKNAYLSLELFRQRPLASLFDIYVWSKNYTVSFLIITLMHCISAYLLVLLFNKCGIKAGLLFVCIFLLCPLNTEASYWISASGRIIVPVFLSVTAAFFLLYEKYIPYYILFVLSLLFYEQAAVFSFLLSLMVITQKKKYDLIYILFFIGCLYISYYLSFATKGIFSQRSQLGYNPTVFSTFFYMIRLFTKLSFHGITFTTVAIAVSASFFTDNGNASLKGFLWGIIYFFGGIIIFMFLKNPTIGFRCLFIPLIGVSLMIDSIFSKKYRQILSPILALLFIVLSANDLYFYKENYCKDKEIIKFVAENTNQNTTYAVSGLSSRNIYTGKDFAQFIEGIGSSDWALTGGVRAYKKDPLLPYFITQKSEFKENLVITIEN